MRAIIQRVTQASVSVENETIGSIKRGFLILLGVGHNDTNAQAERLWNKILKLRIFDDEAGKTNLSLLDVDGQVLIISQFTLYADCKRGNRPSFTAAAPPEAAERLYEHFIACAKKDIAVVETGQFGADMTVSLVNQGPFTIILDTDNL